MPILKLNELHNKIFLQMYNLPHLLHPPILFDLNKVFQFHYPNSFSGPSGENIWNSRFAPGIFSTPGWTDPQVPQQTTAPVLDYNQNQNPWGSNFAYQQVSFLSHNILIGKVESKPTFQARDNSMLGWQNQNIPPQNVAPQPYAPPKQVI